MLTFNYSIKNHGLSENLIPFPEVLFSMSMISDLMAILQAYIMSIGNLKNKTIADTHYKKYYYKSYYQNKIVKLVL